MGLDLLQAAEIVCAISGVGILALFFLERRAKRPTAERKTIIPPAPADDDEWNAATAAGLHAKIRVDRARRLTMYPTGRSPRRSSGSGLRGWKGGPR